MSKSILFKVARPRVSVITRTLLKRECKDASNIVGNRIVSTSVRYR